MLYYYLLLFIYKYQIDIWYIADKSNGNEKSIYTSNK